MRFARDDGRVSPIEDEVDDAADGPVDRELGRRMPDRVQRVQERADHRSLDVIAHDRPGVGIDADGERSAQRGSEPSEDLVRGFDPGVLDVVDVTLGQAAYPRQASDAKAGVLLAHRPQRVPHIAPEADRVPGGLALDGRSRWNPGTDGHVPSPPPAPWSPLDGASTTPLDETAP